MNLASQNLSFNMIFNSFGKWIFLVLKGGSSSQEQPFNRKTFLQHLFDKINT